MRLYAQTLYLFNSVEKYQQIYNDFTTNERTLSNNL